MATEQCSKLGGFFPKIVDAMKEASRVYYNDLAQIVWHGGLEVGWS
jgi:hypothetical protein